MVDPSLLTRLARLSRELQNDAEALNIRAEETSELLGDWPLERAPLMLLAVNLHGYYTGLETVLERIARLLDDEIPSGPGWHVDLIEQMQTDVPALRPAVVPPAITQDLHELRKFRHFFRNAYVLKLDPDRVREQGERLLRVHPLMSASLTDFPGAGTFAPG